MELENRILEKISKICGLLSQINNYWTKIEITKSIEKYNFSELNVSVYTFLKEEGIEEKRLAYIINEKIDLTETTAEQCLGYLINKIEELITPTLKDND